MDFIKMLEETPFWTKPLSVIAYLFRASDENGFVIATYKQIQKDTGVSEPIIAKVMITLQKKGVINKIHNGLWQIVGVE